MKLYNHWISFKYDDGRFDRTDNARKLWKKTKQEANIQLNEDLDWLNSRMKPYCVPFDWGLEEKEFDTISFRGKVGDNGGYDEDFSISIGEEDLYKNLYEKFKDLDVEVTVKFM
jgi:hypothetical protein